MAKKKLRVSVVIPNFNGLDLLKKNLPLVRIAANNSKNNIDEIIVVDDASIDDSVKFVKTGFPFVRIVKHKVNRGFSAAVNTGVRSAKSELIVLLNTDVAPAENFLTEAIKHFKKEGVFAVSLNEKGYSWAKGKFENGFVVHEPGKKSSSTHVTFWVSGGSGVFRRSLWMELKGLDESLYKFYWEDVDLSYRAAKRGWSLLWEPKSKVTHKHESSTSAHFTKARIQRMQESNQLTFIWKNLTSAGLFRKHIKGLLIRLLKHPGYFRVVFATIPKISKIRKARKIEIKECKVSDEAIFARF